MTCFLDQNFTEQGCDKYVKLHQPLFIVLVSQPQWGHMWVPTAPLMEP